MEVEWHPAIIANTTPTIINKMHFMPKSLLANAAAVTAGNQTSFSVRTLSQMFGIKSNRWLQSTHEKSVQSFRPTRLIDFIKGTRRLFSLNIQSYFALYRVNTHNFHSIGGFRFLQ